jgi:hypothetical protein
LTCTQRNSRLKTSRYALKFCAWFKPFCVDSVINAHALTGLFDLWKATSRRYYSDSRFCFGFDRPNCWNCQTWSFHWEYSKFPVIYNSKSKTNLFSAVMEANGTQLKVKFHSLRFEFKPLDSAASIAFQSELMWTENWSANQRPTSL